MTYDYKPGQDHVNDPQAHDAHVRRFILTANRIARDHGYARATHIVRGDDNVVQAYQPYGYHKYSTVENVANANRPNFGWTNTYYQHARVLVSLNDTRKWS